MKLEIIALLFWSNIDENEPFSVSSHWLKKQLKMAYLVGMKWINWFSANQFAALLEKGGATEKGQLHEMYYINSVLKVQH